MGQVILNPWQGFKPRKDVPGGESTAGFQTTKGDPRGSGNLRKTLRKGCIYQVALYSLSRPRGCLPGVNIDIPATHHHRRHPVLTYLLMRHSFSLYLPNRPGEIYCSTPPHEGAREGNPTPPRGGSRRPPRAPTMTICMPVLICHSCPVSLGTMKKPLATVHVVRGSSGSLPG